VLRSLARVTALLAALALATPALAADKEGSALEKARTSFGLSFTPFDVTTAGVTSPVPATTDVLVGFEVGTFRLEPSLGFSRFAIDGGQKGSDFNLGCGLLVPARLGKAVSLYAGGRLLLGFVSANNGAGFSASGVDFTLAAVAGGEWFADPHFSLGAEARIGYTALSDLSDAGVVLRAGASTFSTSGHLVFRYYL
jgi:hypothetical protein